MNKKRGGLLHFCFSFRAQFEFKICRSQPLNNFTAKTAKSQVGIEKYPTFFCLFTTYDLSIRYRGDLCFVNKLLTFINTPTLFFFEKMHIIRTFGIEIFIFECILWI